MLAGFSVCARGGFELDFQWAEGKTTDVTVLSKAAEICRIIVGRRMTVVSQGKALESKDISDGVVEFPTSKGKSYVLQPR